jgi:two-component system nitrogen regulation sensor histidine kinase NtrY
MTTESAVLPAPVGSARGRSSVLFAIGITLAAILTGIATFFAVSGAGPIAPASKTMLWLVGLSFILASVLTAMLALRIIRLARSRAAPETGARLHLRFASLFSLAAVAPAVVVAMFLGLALSAGVEQWFSPRVKSVVESGAGVGAAYLNQAVENVRGEILAMGEDLNNAKSGLTSDVPAYNRYLARQASLRSFPAAYVINRQGLRLASVAADGAAPYKPPEANTIRAADSGQISVDLRDPHFLRALYRLAAYEDAYLYVTRPLDAGIVERLLQFDKSVNDYRDAEKRRGTLQTLFGLSYLSTAWLVLLAAVWLGLSNATRIAEPIGALADAAARVASGDVGVRVQAGSARDEVQALQRAFNRMSEQIEAQRDALVRARSDAEQRSGFTQAVLSGVSAGVVGLDRSGRVTAINRSAETLLGLPLDTAIGRRLADLAPEFGEMLNLAPASNDEPVRVDLVRDNDTRHLSVRASSASGGEGLVLTFDDMTKLIAAQRQEAWKDVARRIAHEIKNPLTPIQLSAERLRRKYAREITSDRETFERCTDTILRQVADIGRMVDEFSTFARMPVPRMSDENLTEIVRSSAFAQRLVFADTRFEVETPEDAFVVRCDGRLIAQALTNLLKNAAEAIQTRRLADGEPKEGRVLVRLFGQDGEAHIDVIDNGAGFPAQGRSRVVEPYVTTRAKGTGLGLAIVQRVAEDHGGRLELDDAPGGGPGARVSLILATSETSAQAEHVREKA